MKMDESEENISAEDIQNIDNAISVKIKPKKRSLVERELETNLTARVTSPVTSEGSSTSRYGRARRLKTGVEETEKIMKPLKIDVSKTQPQAYKMHASNSPVQKESPKRAISVGSSIEDQIENIYNENISLSRFGSEEKAKSQSPAKKFSKVYIRKDLIQKPDTDTVVLIKNMFSPNKSNSHLNNILERSSEKYSLNGHGKAWNGFPDTSSVVKTLDFDGNKKKKDVKEKVASKNELFDVEASCEYQVGDLAWGRVGTYPFWPCIVTREPYSDMFVKKKLFGRVERAVIHVTFFGDNGRRGWIVDNMLRKYHGRTEFEAAREKFTPEAKKKDPRLYAAHFVSEKKLALWNVSVDEAETLMKEPKRLRIDALYDMLERNRAVKTTPKHERGGKITRTDSDVSLSESLYDTLFSEDDGKTDDNNRAKKARNKSLDVSEVVTACLDNMAAKSGIIQIQRQSHMDRWLQKAKSKTPEKIQPRLQIKVEKEKRKDKVKKKAKEGKKPHKLRKNESLGSESNLLPYQNEHDYSSVNYENHDINDSSNKNTDSASGHDSTLDSSGIAITIKVESLSSSMEDCSQDDIITTVVNDDMVMTETENISKSVNEDKNHTDNMNNRIEHNKEIENNNEHNLEISKTNVNEQIESPVNNSDLTNSVQPRRSKRKRQTFEGLNNSIPENKAKEPKLNLEEPKIKIDVTTPNCSPDDNEIQENLMTTEKASESTEIELDQKIDKESSASNLEIDTSHPMKQKLKQVTGFNSNFKPVVVIEPLKIGDLETHIIVKQSKLLDSIIQNTENNSKALDSSTFHSETVDNSFEKSASQTTNLLHVNINKVDIIPDAATVTRSNDVRSKQNQCDISTDCKQHTAESTIDSERMEVDNCATLVAAEKDKTKNFTSGVINSETNADPIKTLDTDVANKMTAEVPLVQEHKKTIIDNNGTNVVIGEETFIFDRTLSQDYDEINADQCDEKNKSPTTSSNRKDKDTHLDPTKPEELILENDQNIKSDTESTELVRSSNDEDDLTTKDNCASPHAPTNDLNSLSVLCDPGDSCIVSNAITKKDTNSDVPHNCIFLDKGNIDNEAKVTTPEDNRLSSATSNVSNVINEEQNEVSKQITEDNNSKYVFLDKSTDMTKAPLNNSKDRKQKSPRLRLNRVKYCLLKLHNKNGEIQKETHEHNIKKVNTSPNRSDLKMASPPNSDNSEASNKHKGRTIEKQDTKKSMNDPEFIKYLEIRQDALIDEQPDLTQDEIATYLYQNWLYEENNKSDIKKLDDTEQSNLVKGLKQEVAPQPKKIRLIRKKSDDFAQSNLVKGLSQEVAPQPKKIRLIRKKSEKDQESKSVDIRSFMQKEQPARVSDELKKENCELTSNVPKLVNHKDDISNSDEVHVNIENRAHDSKDSIQTTHVKLNDIDDSKSPEIRETRPDESDNLKQNDVLIKENIPNDVEVRVYPELEEETKNVKILSDKRDSEVSESLASSTDGASNLNDNNASGENKEKNGSAKINMCTDTPITDMKSVDLKQSNVIDVKLIDELKVNVKHIDLEISDQKESKNPTKTSKLNGFIENKEVNVESKTNDEFDPETASINSEDSGVSMTRRRGRPKEKQSVKMAMDDPEFVKYLETRQDALIDEQPDLTQDEIVTYLYQTWFYEESNKSELKKTDDNEQSNLVKGLNQEPAPQPKKIKKKSKSEKEPQLKNVDIRVMIQKEKPKRKATQSKPYYNEEDSDLEEEDLETFKIFDRSEEDVEGEEIDEVELYFEKLTKPKPNVFKGYVRERVCEICEIAGSLVKCKSCHGTFHVNCVKKEAEVTEVAAPTRGRKRKRGRKPKGYDSLLDSESQSDERSQDANNSEELNMSLEEEAASHIVIDADNFENQWELKIKELQTDDKEEYASDQEINWEVEPGHCEIVDIKHKEKPIDYSDYKCNNCLKYDTPVCFVCKSNKSPKTQTEVRQKCQVAHCHRYYHLECLDHWPQTQFNSWEPSKTNKKVIEYIEALSCPRHVCHTCVSDDPRGCKTRFCGDKLARCVKCPATYHSYTKCLPAGTQILTGSQIICPRHYEHRPGKVPCHVNTGWCFICALGGTLICCEYCPTSFHAECLNIKPPEGSYMCEDCETGRLPLYGEMVWVKLGHYRWWPGIVLHPTEIPDNIMAVKHSPGEFVVRFFGQYDHYWVNRGRVFPFQEGDSGRISSQKSKIDAAFTTAMEHAQRACEILKKMEPNEEEDMDIASSLLPPHYVKLKVNKPLGVARRDADANSLTQCDCDPSQPDPCGPYSHCLNRMLLTECGPLCRAGDRCNNRAFEKRLYPRLAAYRTPQRGWGLRTLEDIKQGQFVIEYVGELIDLEEFRRRMCRKHEIRDENFYFLTLDKERMIDAGPKGNLARFMNHCCEPNCETQKWTVLGDVRVGLFALRDIPANSEVTFNYNLECAGIEKKRCLCGAKRCSGYIGAKPKQLQDDLPKKLKPPAKRTYKKRKPVEDPTTSKTKILKIKIKPIKPRELTEIEKDLLIIKSATNGMSSDSEGSRLSSVDEKNPKALKRKRVSFSTDEVSGKKAKLTEDEVAE